MKKAIIHDWLDKYGGAERVINSITEIMDFDFYYSYFDVMPFRTKQIMYNNENILIETSYLGAIFGKKFRLLLPVFFFIVKFFNFQTRRNQVDIVFSSSWALSKGYRIGNEIHISYFQARNFKYIWDESDLYFSGKLRFFRFLLPFLRIIDKKHGQNPDFIIVNSKFVQNWVKNVYKRDSFVIYPPVNVDQFFVSNEKLDYFVTIGRLEPYKRFDIIVKAFSKLNKKLLVIGDGSLLNELKNISSPNIEFLGYKNQEEIQLVLSKAKAFVFSGIEDFGIAIVESLASGVPVIAYDGGAINELIINYSNGILYSEQNVDSLTSAINDFESNILMFDPFKIKESAEKFSRVSFQTNFLNYVNSIVPNFSI